MTPIGNTSATMSFMTPIGNRVFDAAEYGAMVRRRRQELGLTQQELADSIGVARRVVGELERGKPTVRLQIAMDAASALGLSLYSVER